MPDQYNFENIRTMLTKGFSDGELRDFCQDRAEFRPVYNNLTYSMNKTEIIRLIIDYAHKQILVEILLAWAKKHNLNGYLAYQPYYHLLTDPAEISEDGQLITNKEKLRPPLPAFEPFLLEQLNEPSGTVSLSDELYIEREDDALLKSQVVKSRSITTIRAPRQTGKSSLLVRGLQHARQHGANVVRLDLQEGFGETELHSLDTFLRALAEIVAEHFGLTDTEKAWAGSPMPKRKLTRFVQDYILANTNVPFVLAMDEADRLLQTDYYNDFFGLLRSWYNKGADENEWKKLNLVLVISTEPHLFIDDVHQSPFNIGLRLNLQDFNELQVHDLNHRYGSPVQAAELSELIHLLSGQPYLTRKALYTMAVKKLSWANLKQIVATDNGPFADHLSYQYRLLINRPDLRRGLKQVINTGYCSDEQVLYHLLRAGLVKGKGQIYTLRCELYRLYFEHKL